MTDSSADDVREDLGRPFGPRRAGQAGDPLHRSAPGSRSDQPAGLRRAAVDAAERSAGPSGRSPRPTIMCRPPIAGCRSPIPISKQQIDTLAPKLPRVRHPALRLNDAKQGIVHIIGPELGLTQPGMTIVCGDSHTATHGRSGALAFGIGTSEVEHVLATQTLLQSRPKTFELRVDGRLPRGVTAKDMILYLIGQITTDGGTGYVIEYTGSAIRSAVDGRAADGLQYVDRGGCSGRHDRPGSNDVRLSPRPRVRSQGFRRGRARAGSNCRAIRARRTTALRSFRPPTSRRKSLGAPIRGKSRR